MSGKTAKLLRLIALVALVGWATLPAFAGGSVPVTATLTGSCLNCFTDAGGTDPTVLVPRPYSLLSDGFPYLGGDPLVLSNILTNNSVYTLDTSATLVNGLVGTTTRTVNMHFYSAVECKPGDCPFPNNVLPPCWGGEYDQDQAVNWSIFAPVSFLRMAKGAGYQGMARLNFNVRNADCDRQINRFRLEWPVVCITRSADGNSWDVTSQACGSSTANWGEAHLQAYGGTKKNTVDYGDWRMPFKLNLTK